ncbi:hypothetical protein [Emticicia sp. SJ17W-69]|uniref:hypothetical protein n=1 Tax=Emticicia sp. SJ17W-69 TaxID=3421657 RepID=UPI003EC0BCDD
MKTLKNKIAILILLFFNLTVKSQPSDNRYYQHNDSIYHFELLFEKIQTNNTITNQKLNKEIFKLFQSKVKVILNYQKKYKKNKREYFPYVTTYQVDTLLRYNDIISIVYKVNEENATPGLEDFFYEIFNFKLIDSQAIFFEKRYFYKENNAKIQQIIEQQLPQCKIFDQANLNRTIIQIQKNQFLVLIWKGLLDLDYIRCIDDKFWVKIENNFNNLNSIVFSTKKIKDKVFLNTTPNTLTKMYLLKGDEVEIIDEKDEWLKIRYYGKKTVEGWIKKSDVEDN